jgi:hypothetical protein
VRLEAAGVESIQARDDSMPPPTLLRPLDDGGTDEPVKRIL